MEIILWQWVDFALRWLHVITGIAWIGSSFYFVHLDSSLQREQGLPAGAGGHAWQVHGGGFYHMIKYMVAPAQLPDKLTWFKWEAYSTWISGFFLLVVLYYARAELYLVDPLAFANPVWIAVAVSIALLILGWIVYDVLCRSRLGRSEAGLSAAGLVFLVALAWLCAQLFSGRGAFMQMGAMIGTIMSANVFFVIIPNQKKVVAALLAGHAPDPVLGEQAKQRSMHNNYLTLPVVFLMISNHYPTSFASRWNWLIFALVLVVGAVIRHFYNQRHRGLPNPWWTWGVAVAGMALIVLLSAGGPSRGERAATPPAQQVSFADVEAIVLGRCSMCHAAEPLWPGLATAPKGVLLDHPELIRLHAREIYLQAAASDAMPPGNVTDLEPEERGMLAAWYRAGAPAE
ncbi:MAG TPA: urate hydroxylase PuuD [Geminicoccaceae bacterium]|nr:urate hydroxylase PuuD [Geminicoccaceae bacterium]